MSVELDYVESEQKGKLLASQDLPDAVWTRLTALALRVQPTAEVRGRSIEMEWLTVLSMATRLADLRRIYQFRLHYSAPAREQLQRFRENYDRIHATAEPALFEPQSVQELLNQQGFKRDLKPYQLRDAARMASTPNGANFSVPGAGKTTVALAVNLLTADADTKLLVVAPKNAFSAWDEVLTDCLDSVNTDTDMTPFHRLESPLESIRAILRDAPSRMLISYDQLIRVADIVSDFIRAHRVHVIVDESHKMKSGLYSQRGAVLLNLAHLPTRRDILSGTPIPNSILDISPQVDFLWPGQGIGRRISDSPSPAQILRPLYVRTTKQELDLPPVDRRFETVEMSKAQLALYSILRDAILATAAGIRSNANVDIVSARRSILRLLQVSSNPVLAVRALTSEDPEDFLHNDPTLEGICTEIVRENDSPKMLKVVELAEVMLARNAAERVVIWSTFKYNVERLTELLRHHGATFIHGDVPVGDANDPNTREGRIRRFHAQDNQCRVLVANPSSCSEGISLHKVCHNAIYLDRSYNAAHYLQSVDRIHRLGLKPDAVTEVVILESRAPGVIGSIDLSVRRRMITKLNVMSQALEDEDLQRLALDEQEADDPLDFDITQEDILDALDELSGTAPLAGEEND